MTKKPAALQKSTTSKKKAGTKEKAKKSALNKKTRKSKTPLKKVLTPEILDPSEAKAFREPDPTSDSSAPRLDPPDFDDADHDSPKTQSAALVPAGEKNLSVSDPIARYLMEIRKYPLLSREEEHDLAVRYFESKHPEAAEKLVTSNLRFVVKIASEYSKFGAKLIDLIQEGNVGLMHAVREFNPYKGVRLITYAVWWIRGYIQEYLMRQYSMVRIGTTQAQRKLFYQLQREKDALERLGPSQVVAQLSGRLGVSKEEVETMRQRMSGRDVSLNQPLSENDQSSLLDFQKQEDAVPVDEQIGHQEELHRLTESIEHLRDQLNERELFLLENRLMADEPLTLQEIGDKYGITREAARQMEARLIHKIKGQMVKED